MPRRPKYKGTISIDTKRCECGSIMFKQIKEDLLGKEWVCSKCNKKEEI